MVFRVNPPLRLCTILFRSLETFEQYMLVLENEFGYRIYSIRSRGIYLLKLIYRPGF